MSGEILRILILFRVAAGALRVNVLRSILTLLGIIIGVGSVIIMVAMGAGAQAKVDTFIEGLGGNVLVLFGGMRGGGGPVNLGAGEVQTLSEKEIALIEETAERTWTAIERSDAERALRASEERFRRLLYVVLILLGAAIVWRNAG